IHYRHLGFAPSQNYLRCLTIATDRGDYTFIRALVDEIGSDLRDDAFIYCEFDREGTAATRNYIVTLLAANLACPDCYKPLLRLWAETDHRFIAYCNDD